MNRYVKYNLTIGQLINLLESKRCARVYKVLHEPITYYDSLDQLAKQLKYKNRSGLWKALKELDKYRLIQFIPDKKKIIILCARISFEEIQ